ncbi:MAG TPA: extracellular solute-binding protein [Candidatus Bathyarchaeia archaeon]|nr:extracellular solute-binding protein [Candidatus Bathyarchaeia archaeon]
MNKKISVIFSFVLVLAIVVLSGCGCANNSATNYEVRLEVWGLDDSDSMVKAISEYQKRNPRVKEIVYKKVTVDTYENDLMDALATGNGPDIFLVHNTWLSKHQDKLAPAPVDNLSSAQAPILTPKQIQDQFADVVTSDFVSDGKIYALPLSVDSLALFYNKDLFNQAGISVPPATWLDFDEAARKITRIDSLGNITLSGAAMGMSSEASPGTGKINRGTDILTLLMMQSGANMINPKNGQAGFADFTDSTFGGQISPGESALSYYTKFAVSSPSNVQYSWNSLQHNSIDAFIEGKTAMMINYSWQIPKIQSKAPKLNLGITPVPQNKDQSGNGMNIDFANYWGYAVSKNKTLNQNFVKEAQQNRRTYATDDQRIAEAWKFTRYLTMSQSASADLPVAPATADSAKFDPAADYTASQQKPAARRDLIEKQKTDILLASFASGNLIAKSWPQPDNLAVERIFDDMIDNVVLKNMKVHDAIQQAQNGVDVLMRK